MGTIGAVGSFETAGKSVPRKAITFPRGILPVRVAGTLPNMAVGATDKFCGRTMPGSVIGGCVAADKTAQWVVRVTRGGTGSKGPDARSGIDSTVDRGIQGVTAIRTVDSSTRSTTILSIALGNGRTD